jgi:uncharacterized protein (TIGR02270 family)
MPGSPESEKSRRPEAARIPPRLVRWDILEECLDEAAFLWSQWERALTSPDYTLPEVAYLEERLLARLDPLVLGGAPASKRLLQPSLESEEPERLGAAALALLMGDGTEHVELLLELLQRGTEPQRAALCRAFELSEREGVESHLMPLLQRGAPEVQASVLDVLTARRASPDVRLEQLLARGGSPMQAAVLRAASHMPLWVAPSLLDEGLRSDELSVRDAALEAGLVLGHAAAWTTSLALVSRREPGCGFAMLLLALGGSAEELPVLLEALSVPGLRRQALWALGFSGRGAAAEACLPWMRDDKLARLAGEAFSAITGLTLEGEFALRDPDGPDALVPLEEEDLDADLVPSLEERLPCPNAEAVEGWWRRLGPKLEPGTRYLGGRPLTHGGVLAQLSSGNMRRRPPLALELAIRTHGKHRVCVRAFSARQLRELRLLQQLPELNLHRGFAMLQRSGPPAPPPGASSSRLGRGMTARDGGPPPPSRSAGLAVTAVGMASSLGDDVVSSCAASRAGVLRISELDTLQLWDPRSEALEPAKGHAAVPLTRGFQGVGRLARLGAAALRDLTESSGLTDWRGTGLFIALPSSFYLAAHERRLAEQAAKDPEAQGSTPPPTGIAEKQLHAYQRRLLPALLHQARVDIRPEQCQLFFGDQLGFIRALRAAEEALSRGTFERCIVGGIDSLVEPLTLEALENVRLLRGPSQPARLLPGEASAFVLVEQGRVAERRGVALQARLSGSSEAKDVADRLSGTAATGRALSEVILATLGAEPCSPEQIGWVVGDLNGDERRAQDWGLALVRLRATHALGEVPQWHVAESFGAIGAATGPAAVCLVVRALARGYAPASRCLVWLAADDGARGALSIDAVVP